jgi:hypothetical protein
LPWEVRNPDYANHPGQIIAPFAWMNNPSLQGIFPGVFLSLINRGTIPEDYPKNQRTGLPCFFVKDPTCTATGIP